MNKQINHKLLSLLDRIIRRIRGVLTTAA